MGSWRNSAVRYGRVAQSLHWVVAALVMYQVWIGVHVDDLPLGIERLKWMSRHKEIGISILFIVLLRLAWRRFDPPPGLPASVPQWQRRLATINHWLLYGLLIAAAFAGWLAASAAGLGINWFGLFSLPDLIDKNPAWQEGLRELHESIVILLALLIIVHAGGAVWHAIRRDGVMNRMLPPVFDRRGSGSGEPE